MEISHLIGFFGQGWVGSLIGVIGILVGVAGLLLFRASKSRPNPAFQIDALRLIQQRDHELPDEVSISYKGRPVQRLTKTRLIFWNAGSDTLRASEVVEADPLRIVFEPGSEILRADIVRASRPINRCKLVQGRDAENEIKLDFDFLDAGDGVSIEILHTSKERGPKIQGTIRGVPEGVVNWGRILASHQPAPLPLLKARKPIFIFGLIFGLVLMSIGLIPNDILLKSVPDCPGEAPKFPQLAVVLFGALYVALTTLVLWTGRKRYPKGLDFDKAAEEST